MKVCPTCHSRFLGGETFCPHDGSKLVDARELSPGEMTGSKLDDVVRLDRLMHSDGLGERYSGRLLDSRRAVFVTVLNQAFIADDDATARLETARARVGSPLPFEINTILQLHLEKNPPYIIESEPRGPSVRQLLLERRQLDWKEAVKITAHLARIVQWLHEQGVPFHNVHPSGVYVTKLATGDVQLGDWGIDALVGSDSPARLVEESGDAFVGYVDYLAPEVGADSSKSDLRSAVYALGCLLYEMVLGKPPLPGRTASETIKRHRHEKPVRLTIARGGGEFPESLDDLVEMMLAKEPDKRFQSANAVVAALSNLVDMSPEELAPPLRRAAEAEEDDLYRTIDMDSVARDDVMPPSESAEPSAQDPPPSVSQAGTIVGTSHTRDDAEETDSPAKSRSGAEEHSAPAPSQEHEGRRTLLFGSIGEAVEAAATAANPGGSEAEEDEAPRHTLVLNQDGEPVSDGEDAHTPTLMMGSGTATTEATSGFDREAAPSAVMKGKKIGKVERVPEKPVEEAHASPDAAQVLRRSDISAELDAVAPPPGGDEDADDAAHAEASAGSSEAQSVSEAPTRKLAPLDASAHEPTGKGKKGKRGKNAKSGPSPNVVVEPEESATAPEPERKTATDEPEIKPARDQTRELDRSEWFASPTEDAWDASLADEHRQQTERRFRFIIGGVLALLVVAVAGIFIYSEYLYVPEEEQNVGAVAQDAPAQAATVEPPAYDAPAVKTAFDEAVAAGRLVAPLSNSALHYLTDLKRRAPESAEYTAARQTFVTRAKEAAVAADANQNLNEARTLAGYASQFAPEDAELARMTAELQARYTGQSADLGAAPDAGAAEEVAAVAAQMPAEVAVVEPPKEAPKPVEKKVQKREQKPRQKKVQRAPAGDTADSLLKDARVALGRGDTNEARLLYHKALDLDSKNGEIYAGLGKVYFEQSNYREAVKYQQKAVRYASGRLDYRIALGQSFYRLGKYQEAIDVWESVLKKDPDNRFARQYIELAKKKI